MKRFIKTGFRSFKRERFFTGVNLLGLTLGMFCFLITALFVRDELTHDQWQSNGANIYRPRIEFNYGNGTTFNLFPSFNILEGLKAESPGVIDAVNISFAQADEYDIEGDWFETKKVFYSQPELFEVFDFSLALGDEKTALEGKDKVVLSAELAQKHFGKENPIGEFITFKKEGTLQVTGVLDPIPGNSHLRFDMLMPIDMDNNLYGSRKDDWITGTGLNYFLVQDNYTPEQLKADVTRLLEKHEAADYADSYIFERFSELYMNSLSMRGDPDNMFGGQMKYVYIFSIIGVLMLVVACFNYINLTTARSFSRARDMGIKKVIGASRNRIILSQMAETLFISVMALVLAIVSMELLMDEINGLIGKQLRLDLINDPQVLVLPIGLLAIVVLVSGIYPAITASSFNLSAILKGDMPRSNVGVFRKVLVVLQFFICAGLLSGALIIRGQANHLINMELGYNEKNVISLDLTGEEEGPKYAELRAELEKIPFIEKVSGSPLPNLNSVLFIEKDDKGEDINLTPFYGVADKDFNELFELKILEGTDFNGVTESELPKAALINETAQKALGWEDPIGRKLTEDMIVIGVMQDFMYQSAKSSIDPAIITYGTENLHYLQFRFRNGNRDEVLKRVEAAWESFGTSRPFEYQEVAAFFADSYQKEERLVRIFDVLTIFLITVAFLGLFALSSFESQLREKEVGIRKVLGASYLNLIGILNRRFVLLIAVALITSIPLSYYLINQWLQDFPYQINSVVPYFAIASAGILVMALCMLSVHGFFNSRKNPVEVLRNQ